MPYDVKPQFFRGYVIQSAANTYTEKAWTTPVIPSLGKGKALVMELLKIFLNMDPAEIIDAAASQVHCHIADRSDTTIRGWDQSHILASYKEVIRTVDTAATDGTIVARSTAGNIVFDLTDNNGNGVLFAKKEVYIAINSGVQVSTKTATFAILYRLVEVSAEELIGIIS